MGIHPTYYKNRAVALKRQYYTGKLSNYFRLKSNIHGIKGNKLGEKHILWIKVG